MESSRLLECEWVEKRIDDVMYQVPRDVCLDCVTPQLSCSLTYVVFERSFYAVVGLDDTSV